jgi:hypothetical protein
LGDRHECFHHGQQSRHDHHETEAFRHEYQAAVIENKIKECAVDSRMELTTANVAFHLRNSKAHVLQR